MFVDRFTGVFQGAYHYPREIKSGFIYLGEQDHPEEPIDVQTRKTSLGDNIIDAASSFTGQNSKSD
jgi:hypothetical protein